MKLYRVKTKDKTIGMKVKIANNAIDRLMGLMFTKTLPGCDGLLIEPCNSIHTFFMRYPIDVLFLDRNKKIVKIVRNIKPWRMTWMYWKATSVLELAGNSLSPEIKEGEQLILEEYV